MRARRGARRLAVVCGVLLIAGCSSPSRAVRDFAEGVTALDAGSYDAREIACSDTVFEPYATDRPETTVGYFACWRWVGSVEEAGRLAEVLGAKLIGGDADFFGCSEPGHGFFRCVTYDKTGGLGPVVYLSGSAVEGEFDIGFGSVRVPVSQMDVIISDG